MAKNTKGKTGKSKGGSKKLSFPEKVSLSLKKENYGKAKTLCEIECKAFGTDKFSTMKKCDKCPEVVKEFCKEMLDGVYQEDPGPDAKETEKVSSPVRNDQPYSKVLRELIKGTSLKDIAVVIAGEVPTPKSFIGKVSCIFGAITGKSKAKGVIFKGVKELKAGKKITKTGSSGYVSKVWDAYQEVTKKDAPKKAAKAGAGKKGKGSKSKKK